MAFARADSDLTRARNGPLKYIKKNRFVSAKVFCCVVNMFNLGDFHRYFSTWMTSGEQSRRYGGFGGLSPPNQSSKPPKLKYEML